MKIIRALSAAALAVACSVLGWGASAAPSGFTVSGHHLLRGGQPFTPYGFTLSAFQNGTSSFAPGEYATVAAQLRAIRGAWHGNIVRLQIEQDEYLYGGDGQSARVFRDKVNAVIGLAERDGLAVVINDQTEGGEGIYTRHDLLPTGRTLAFWRLMERYRHDPAVIIDPFNEPRYYPRGSTHIQQWDWWHNGVRGRFIGAVGLIRDLRAYGFTGQLWMEAPGNTALSMLVSHLARYRLPGADVVYEFHHTAVDQNAVPTVGEWNAQFGYLVTRDNLPVVDGEWTNRSMPAAVYSGAHRFEPSGDIGPCWGNAPVSVPRYLAYLKSLGIGMTVWTLGPQNEVPSLDYINADGDNRTFTTANSYAHWQGCLTPRGGHTSGAGSLLMSWFAAGNP